jgi:serine/threonine-protein phosphatase 6 catalytic subunit|eukprot:TRINITY_DN6079_c0_g1_i1.p1 TRINITY_DN6079_c0_g1~~TRINITY_DN6079_c0_g1_i1.p1  ORF type:complete len:311 (-),score=122.19 TRINITY_DN6079_c0_g1_i1:121-1053(-)
MGHPILTESDLDGYISVLKQCKVLPEPDLKRLIEMVKYILMEEPNVQEVAPPVIVCGDIHGQFHDLLELFRIGGEVPHSKYIFMGDYVDRGYFSVETFTYLLALKARHPDCITLLRGNHESRQITQVYGFYDECFQKYGSATPWKMFTQIFDLLNVAAVIGNKVFCVHGGLSPELKTIDQIRTIKRDQEIPIQGAYCDLMWSDPEEIETWQVGPRGTGWLFGSRVVGHFLQHNGLDLMARAHQLVQEGYKFMFDQQLVTVWSAPNYCYRCGNVASIMTLDEGLNRDFKIFNAVPENEHFIPKHKPISYFT